MYTEPIGARTLTVRFKSTVPAWITILVASTSAQATSIVLQSSTSGVFQYQLVLGPGESAVFDMNSEINLSGLSGITSTSAQDIGFSSCGFTPSTACFVEQFGSETFSNSTGTGNSQFNLFTITSTSSAKGLVDYTAAAESPFSGQAQGPVDTTTAPDPGTGLLTAAGLAGFLLLGGMQLLRNRA